MSQRKLLRVAKLEALLPARQLELRSISNADLNRLLAHWLALLLQHDTVIALPRELRDMVKEEASRLKPKLLPDKELRRVLGPENRWMFEVGYFSTAARISA